MEQQCTGIYYPGTVHPKMVKRANFVLHILTILKVGRGQPRWLSGLVPPLTQGLVLETRDRVPRWAPGMEPASPSACVSASLSLCVCMTIINK